MLIDSPKFSRERQTARGKLPIAGFERLRDSLFALSRAGDEITEVTYCVSGGGDVLARPVLRLTVSGRLQMRCQRCLKALDHELAIDTTLRLVPEAAMDIEISDDPDEPDCIAASTELDLAALIEDEILLALPAYPRHENGNCSNVEGKVGVGTGKVSAFSALGERSEAKRSEVKKNRAFTLKE